MSDEELIEWGRENHFWFFENLNRDENLIILRARSLGFANFYPMFPTWEDQGLNTLKGAMGFLEKHPNGIYWA